MTIVPCVYVQSSTSCATLQGTLCATPSARLKMDMERGQWQVAPAPRVVARGSLPLCANFKLSGSVDPYLSSEPHHWTQLNPGSVEFQSQSALTDTNLFATGILEIFQDLSGYCQPWGSCQPCTSMGNVASTSFSASEGELNTPEIGDVNGFQFIDDGINHFGGDFSPEVLDAFLNSAEDVDVMEEDQTKIDSVVGLCSPSHDISVVEHEEVVGEYEELQSGLSCSVKLESVSDCASPVSCDEMFVDEQCVDAEVCRSDRELNKLLGLEDLPFLPEQTVTVMKPKLDFSRLVFGTVLPADDVIHTPEVLQLLCEADENYGLLTCRSNSADGAQVPEAQSPITAELHLPSEQLVAVLEETDKQANTRTRNETTSKPAEKVSRKRRGAAVAEIDSDVDVAAPVKRTRRMHEEAEPSGRRSYVEPRQSAVGKRRKSSVSLSNEEDICQKYRELRDRNNEASRRSRLNRKTQDEEMRRSADHLEKENERLRTKVQELEKLRDKVKEALLRIVKGKGV